MMKLLCFLLFQLLSTTVKINAAPDHYEVEFTSAPSFRRLNAGECRSGQNENGGDPTRCQRTDPIAENAPLDHYEVVFTWAPSYCTVDPAKVACKSGYKENFYLYGMWPMDKDDHDPTIQLPDRTLNDSIKRLQPDLEASWPSLTTKPAEILWREQWYEHGRHGNLYPEDYFRRATTVFKETRLKKYLREANPRIKPDVTKMYLKADIEDAVSNGRGRPNDHVRVTSREHPRTKNHVLYEIKICLNSRAQYATCARPSPPPAICLYPPKN